MNDKEISAKRYGRMHALLLLTAACIAIDQTLLSVVILIVLLKGIYIAVKERDIRQVRIWPRYLKWLLFLLLATGYISLHNPMISDTFSCTICFCCLACDKVWELFRGKRAV